MEGKRVLVMEKLAKEMDWPDMGLFSDCKRVSNWWSTGVFKAGATIANLSEEELEKNIKFLRPAILGRLNIFSEEEL